MPQYDENYFSHTLLLGYMEIPYLGGLMFKKQSSEKSEP